MENNEAKNVFAVEKSRLLALEARRIILQMTHKANASHVGSSLSVVDVLAVLYSGGANINPQNCFSPNRDVIILSKGHAAAAIYAILALKEFFPVSRIQDYCVDGSSLGGHITHENNPGIELSTGSLGHGLPYGIGVAFSQKMMNLQSKTFVIVSDGECDEGTTWESALLAQQFKLDNLVLIIDRNHIQSLSFTESTVALEPLADKWRSFNWEVLSIDGHSHSEIYESIQTAKKPLCIIADTTKGKGISFMENSVLWHYRPPTDSDLTNALQELENETQ